MLALVYRKSVPRYLASAGAGKLMRRRFLPALAPVALRDIPFDRSTLDTRGLGPEWLILKVRMCGICGSDLNLLRGAESYLMEPYGSFPIGMGHEIVAEVVDAPDGSGFSAGERVVVEPTLHCAIRGLPPCRFCQQGDWNLCENFTDGILPAGPGIGFNSATGGGMAEAVAAHPLQCLRVPDSMPDETAVLADAMASALQPVLENRPADEDTVIVYGMGVIGQFLVRSLRAVGSRARVVAVARHRFQAELATAGGADQVLMSPTRRELGAAVGARFLPTTLAGGNLEGGADIFYDCVGSPRSLQEGLVSLRGRGRYVMVGTAGTAGGVDISSLWFRELTMTGSVYYGHGEYNGERRRTYELALEFLGDPAFPTSGLLTHTYPLPEWRRAFQTVFDKRGSGSMKVAFDMRG
ncbi:alcohol dehydrogenase [Oceanidesulfovibrio indonesiensis]|uniref:Alcohol dehydrogenase n=1 Tax=Oceanidesulfovibrio indonesiensis TaxID=54767 RepID=A0A7M3MFC2_9BACT|nr:zinc-binding dehydrogenase [Oceanidesulfovibrio indonesiensis]TVM17327.1 alcohol dehydrogenase [Oceanidesulfovibrio indonesiensis]